MATPTTSGVLSPEEFQALLTAVDAHGRARLNDFDSTHPRLSQMFSNWLRQLGDFLTHLSR